MRPAADAGAGSGAIGRDISIAGGYAAGRDIVIHTESGLGQAASVPGQLPAAPAVFADRHDPARSLEAAIQGRDGMPSVVSIFGTAGVGKTALALHVAHRVRGLFPGGHLYVDLRGAGRTPLDPALVLAEFLRSLGVRGDAVPADLDSLAAVFRSQVADRNVLVFLDNAADAAQVRPLLPGSGTSTVLVTSRRRLDPMDTTLTLRLSNLGTAEAVDLLAAVLGDSRVQGELGSAERIAALCGGLPLALRIAGARLAVREHWQLDRLVRRLDTERGRLEELKMGDHEVRAGFMTSYEALSADEQRAFRFLGLVPGVDFPTWAGAALLDVSVEQAEDLLDRLCDAQLLTAAAVQVRDRRTTRYRFHDLLRVFAREQLAAGTSEAERAEAVGRLLNVAFALAEHADRLISEGNSMVPPHDSAWSPSTPRADYLDVVDDIGDPVAWFDAERATLLQLIGQANAVGQWSWTWLLSTAMFQFFERTSRWDDWRAVLKLALEATLAAGDRAMEGWVVRLMGRRHLEHGRFPDAEVAFRTALDIFRETGPRLGEALALRDLAIIARVRNDHRGAIELLHEAMPGFVELGDGFREALAWRELAIEHRYLAQWEPSLEAFDRSMRIFGDLDAERQLAQGWFEMGILERNRLRWADALAHYDRCLPLLRSLGDPKWEAHTLREIGIVARHRGDLDEALARLDDALSRLDALHDRRQWAATSQELLFVHRALGNRAEAVTAGEQALAVFEEYDDELSAARTKAMLIGARLELDGELPALAELDRLLAVFDRYGDHAWLDWVGRLSAALRAGVEADRPRLGDLGPDDIRV